MKGIIFTTTRAEYGLLRYTIKKIQKIMELYVLAGGAHLSITDGYIIDELKKDKIKNIIEIPFLCSSKRPMALTNSIGNGLIQISHLTI